MRWLRPCPLYTPPVATTDWMAQWGIPTGLGMLATTTLGWEVCQTWSFRGSKSRNKVSVGEPAEGSLLSFEKVYDFGHIPFSSLHPFVIIFQVALAGMASSLPRNLIKHFVIQQLGCLLSDSYDLNKVHKTFNNGSLGSGIDEERSKMR